jgi:hypothetical protein
MFLEMTPDLLFQLTTMLSPEVLMGNGCPVSVAHQREGEFVITWPRAYHSGFNQGFNVAEAVNFAPPDWLPHGAECVRRLREYKRTAVFSHEELVVRVVKRCIREGRVHKQLSVWIGEEVNRICREEEEKRELLVSKGLELVEEAFPRILKDVDETLGKLSKMGKMSVGKSGKTNTRHAMNADGDDCLVCCTCNALCYLSVVRLDGGDFVCLDCAKQEVEKGATLLTRITMSQFSNLTQELRKCVVC